MQHRKMLLPSTLLHDTAALLPCQGPTGKKGLFTLIFRADMLKRLARNMASNCFSGHRHSMVLLVFLAYRGLGCLPIALTIF